MERRETWSFVFYYYSLYFSGFFSQLQFMKISCLEKTDTKIKDRNIFNDETLHLPKKTYQINTNINIDMVDSCFKKIVQKEKEENERKVEYFRSYLKCFYNCEKTEDEIERMLDIIQDIRKSVKYEFPIYSSIYGKKVLDVINNTRSFYTKKRKDIVVSLYKMEYCGKPAVVKIYEYYPKFIFSNYLLEYRFENEVVFQKYAQSLNSVYDFISPKIYCFGSVDYESLSKIIDSVEKKYLFLIMEYIPGLSVKNMDFRPDFCKQIYEIDQKLKTRLLSHNDISPRNILVSEKDDVVLLDYGESSSCF